MITISDVVKILRESKLNLTVKDGKINFKHQGASFEIEKFNDNFSVCINGLYHEFDNIKHRVYEKHEKVEFYLDYRCCETVLIWS
jgi:hypothetical protein